MPTNVCCLHYEYGGKCLHSAAPKSWFTDPRCVLLVRPTDARVPWACNLQALSPRPPSPPSPPKKDQS